MRASSIVALGVIGVVAPDALGAMMIADYDFDESVTFVTFNAPLDLPSLDFRLTSEANNYVTHLPAAHSLGDEQLILTSGQSGSVDLGPALGPADFAYFADVYTGQGTPLERAYLSLGAGPDFTIYFSENFSPDPTDLFTPAEIAALQGADLSFFRIIVDDVSIQNRQDGSDYYLDVAASGRVELWVPGPGSALLGVFGIPLLARRRRSTEGSLVVRLALAIP